MNTAIHILAMVVSVTVYVFSMYKPGNVGQRAIHPFMQYDM